jgi:hypothetical protein
MKTPYEFEAVPFQHSKETWPINLCDYLNEVQPICPLFPKYVGMEEERVSFMLYAWSEEIVYSEGWLDEGWWDIP